MKILSKEDLVRIGFVNKTSGYKGNLICITEIARPEKLLDKKFLFLILEGLPVPFAVEKMDHSDNILVVKFEDVDTEDDAKKLVRKEIYSEQIKGGKKKDVFEWKEIIGYTIFDLSYGNIGFVEDIIEYPQHFIAKCTFKGREIMFPFNDDIVTEIDDDKKEIHVVLPDGLIDIYL